MKFTITEQDRCNIRGLYEQFNSPKNNNQIFDQIVLLNKSYLGLPKNTQITPEYTKKMSDELIKKDVDRSTRTIMGSLQNFIPMWGDVLDFTTLIDGFRTKDLEKINGGAIGLLSPHFAYKAITSFVDYSAEKLQGKDFADYWEKKRNEVINMGTHDREELYKRYGMGGYDKWVKAGRPPLH